MSKSKGIRAPRRPWAPAELRVLRDLYPDSLAETIARELRRPVESVYNKAFALGLRKSPGFMKSLASGRIRADQQHPSMVASRFQKGSTPWNKGVNGLCYEGSKATQFKKGEMRGAAQHNYVPIGTLRTCADGYLERKVSDDPDIYPARRWVAEHRLVWEQAHGPIPAGHIVVFRRGQKTTKLEEVTLSRLECITRAENLRRNSPRSRSPELARLVQLKGAITRQVNRINREARERAEQQGASV